MICQILTLDILDIAFYANFHYKVNSECFEKQTSSVLLSFVIC